MVSDVTAGPEAASVQDGSLVAVTTDSLPRPTTQSAHIIAGNWLRTVESPTLLIVGVIGNILSLIIFLRPKLRSSVTALLFRFLAVGDLLYILTDLIPLSFVFIGKIDTVTRHPWGCKVYVFLVFGSRQFAAWVLALVAVERVIGVSMPHKAKVIVTKTRAKIAVSIVAVCLIALNAYALVIMRNNVLRDPDGNVFSRNCAAGFEVHFFTKVWPWLDYVFYTTLPFCIMIACNSTIIYKLVKAAQMRRENLAGDTSPVSMSSMTTMLLLTSFIFLAFGLPYNVYFIYSRVHKAATKKEFASRWLWQVISLALVHLNHSCNFYLYCLSGSRFRQELIAMLCCKPTSSRPRLPAGGTSSNTKAVPNSTKVTAVMGVSSKEVSVHI